MGATVQQRLTPEAWNQYAEEMSRWQHEQDDADETFRTAPASLGGQEALQRIFKNHPTYRGLSALDVYIELRRTVRAAQIQYRLLVTQPETDARTELALMALEAQWYAFGGPEWHNASLDELALERMGYEHFIDVMNKPDATVAEYLHHRDYVRRHPNETVLGAWLRAHRSHVIIGGALALAVWLVLVLL